MHAEARGTGSRGAGVTGCFEEPDAGPRNGTWPSTGDALLFAESSLQLPENITVSLSIVTLFKEKERLCISLTPVPASPSFGPCTPS